MKQQIRLSILMMLMIMVVTSCSPQGSTVTPTTPPVSSGDGVEDQISLIDYLRAAGAEVELGDPVEQDFFSVIGQIIKINGAEVQVFEYSSSEAMESEASQVASDGSSVGTSMMMWVATPHFYKSGRVLVLYVGDEAATLEQLGDALGEQFAGR